jgi:hypothetical protein
MATTCPATNYNFSCPASTLVAAARAKITAAGGTFNGDDDSGTFAVSNAITHVNGNYTIKLQTLTVTITSKGAIVPSCDEIQSAIKKVIASLN